MNFDDSFARLIDARHEGEALSLDRNDPGNWTGGQVGVGQLKGSKFGISAASHPGEDIANLTIERAKQIYLAEYWGPAGCDAVPDQVKFQLFDMAVNSGVRQAIKTLQRAIGAAPDGVLGPLTLQALQSMPAPRLVARFNAQRLPFMVSLPNWASASRGWTLRIVDNLMEA